MNPNLKLSHNEITVVHRSDGSGTTAVFTEYLNGVSPDWRKKVGAGTAVKWPVGIGGKGNEGVANYTQRTANSIGYVEFAYAEQNKLTYTLLKNSAGTFVTPSFDAFEDAADTGTFDPKNHFYLWLVNAPGKNSWPIAGATFILLAQEKTDANRNVVKFYDWALGTEQQGKGTDICAIAEILKGQDQGLLEDKWCAIDGYSTRGRARYLPALMRFSYVQRRGAP